jgi:LasA protease
MQFPSLLRIKILLAAGVLMTATLACARILESQSPNWSAPANQTSAGVAPSNEATNTPFLPATRLPGAPILTPTPDAPHPVPTIRNQPDQYVVQYGDNLNLIAQQYGVSTIDIVNANDLSSPDYLEIGEILTIPAPTPGPTGPAFKIIPDSELVYGPVSAYFDIPEFIKNHAGYLSSYEEDVDGSIMTGSQIVERVAQEYSVNPRLLLGVLEYQSGWVTRTKPDDETLDYPMGLYVDWRKGLYHQLAWAADNLNRGYYLWKVNGLAALNFPNGGLIPINPSINAGTAGVQYFFSQLIDLPKWEAAVSEQGLFATYQDLFGYPFDLSIEPLLPPDLVQPAMQLPFEDGVTWSFTGGPHGGWGSGSAWAALDFAPPGDALGCVQSDAWVEAVADGPIIRAGNGAVVQDIDDERIISSDGLEQTGWTVLYMHVEGRDRVSPGTYLHTGERIGHPSCEGGVSTGTHLHIARRYNGEWIPADQSLPFELDGWVSIGSGIEYDGYLQYNDKEIEAWEGRSPDNAIQR